MTPLERQQRLTALTLGGGGLLVLVSPRWGFHLPWRCPLRLVTGIPCPTCGLTRSLTASLAGEWQRAFAEHAFGPLLLVGSCVGLVGWSLELAQGRSLPWLRAWTSQARARSWMLALSLIAYHGVRLLHWWHTGQLQQWMAAARFTAGP